MNHKTWLPARLILTAVCTLLAVPALVSSSPPALANQAAQNTTEPVRDAEAETETLVPFPDTPPDARKIHVGEPDIAGYAQVEGDPGSVPPQAAVAIINLSAHNVMTATADLQGGFQASLFAPPGSWLLIKTEQDNSLIQSFWRLAADKIADSTDTNLNPLPGTTLYVGGPETSSGNTQSFHTVGAVAPDELPKRWAGWFISGELTVPEHADSHSAADWQMSVLPGDTVTMTLTMRTTSPDMDCLSHPIPDLFIEVNARQLFGADGGPKPWEIWFDAVLFTPTGLPIEQDGQVTRFALGELPHFTNVTCLTDNVLTGEMQTSFTIPNDLDEGYYRPEFYFQPSVPLSNQVPQAIVWMQSAQVARGLPILRVGDAAPPRIPWELFANELVNGQRGVNAIENTARHAMVPRVSIPNHRSVIPAVNERTGEPITYHLEPASVWLSNTDRRLPTTPHIPLLLPSSMLTVEIHQPDGSLQTLGPAPLQGSLVRTPTLPDGSEFAGGTGQIDDLYQLYNFENIFAHHFEQQGAHTISLHGVVQDVFGNSYSLESTYEVMVAHVLDVDPNTLPTTPFVAGDHFAAGVHLFPPVPAHVHIVLTHLPDSDPTRGQVVEADGQANKAGYFQSADGEQFVLPSPGEYRIDISAEYHAPNGEVWFGAMTWGGVVEGANPSLIAHGRRGMDYKSETIDDMPTWFRNQDLPPEKIGLENYYPYFSGDIHWGDQTLEQPWLGDSIHSIITFEDTTAGKTFYNLIRSHYPQATTGFRWPPEDQSINGLEKRIAVNEAPLFITTENGINAELRPEEIDLWSYWYGSSERPDVRVRELITVDSMGTAYWRFNDTYNYQIGEPADGDQPGDIKWEFGGVVLRTTGVSPVKQYAIYSSLWVLLPIDCDDFGCARVTPPFRGAGALNGGPILTLQGRDVDMLFLPKGVRPGDVLEVGDTVSFSGHVGPPLDSRVDVTITSPSGVVHASSRHANKIGWIYDPTFDFTADEPGKWTVDVWVEHDRPYRPTGIIPQNHNTGTVLGTTGRYEFYVVTPDSPRLTLTSPQAGFLNWEAPNTANRIQPITIAGIAPLGTDTIHYTIHDKGIVMGQGTIIPNPTGEFSLIYNPITLHNTFSMLSLTAHEGLHAGLADEVTISLLAVGSGEPRAATVTLIGEEVFMISGPVETRSTVYLPVILRLH